MSAVISSIQVGRPRTFAAESPEAKEWQSAIFKSEVQGAVFVRKTNLEGDQQADLVCPSWRAREGGLGIQ